MDNKQLLNAIGEADDRFIEEAAPEERQASARGKTKYKAAAVNITDTITNGAAGNPDTIKDGAAIDFNDKLTQPQVKTPTDLPVDENGKAPSPFDINNAKSSSAAGTSGAAKIGGADASAKKTKRNAAGVIRNTRWQKWVGAVAAVLAVCIIGGTVVSGGFFHGGRKSAKEEAFDANYAPNGAYNYLSEAEAPQATEPMANKPGAADMSMYDKTEYSGNSSLISSSIANLGMENLKLIYTASMTLQTSDFAQSEKALSDLVARYNGYFESVYVSNNGMYSASDYRSASYTVRVPASGYESFLNEVGETSHIVSLSQSVEDVGESYYEIEGRLETLYTKQKRLQELLAQAANMTDIIELENELSNTEYQIDSLKGSLNHYDSLIGFSTVHIKLETVTRPGSSISQDTSFGARLARAFKNGLTYAADNFESFIIWIAGNIIGIIIFAVIVFLLIRFRPIKKLWKKIRKKG